MFYFCPLYPLTLIILFLLQVFLISKWREPTETSNLDSPHNVFVQVLSKVWLFLLRVFLTICVHSLFHFLLSVTSTSKNTLEKLCIIIIKTTQISNKFLITIIVTNSTYVYFSQICSCLIPSCHMCVIIQNLEDNLKLITENLCMAMMIHETCNRHWHTAGPVFQLYRLFNCKTSS